MFGNKLTDILAGSDLCTMCGRPCRASPDDWTLLSHRDDGHYLVCKRCEAKRLALIEDLVASLIEKAGDMTFFGIKMVFDAAYDVLAARIGIRHISGTTSVTEPSSAKREIS